MCACECAKAYMHTHMHVHTHTHTCVSACVRAHAHAHAPVRAQVRVRVRVRYCVGVRVCLWFGKNEYEGIDPDSPYRYCSRSEMLEDDEGFDINWRVKGVENDCDDDDDDD